MLDQENKDLMELLDAVSSDIRKQMNGEDLAKSEGLQKDLPIDQAPDAPMDAAPEQAPMDNDQGMDPAADAGVSPEELKGEYAKLSPEELEMHFQCLMEIKNANEAPADDAPPMDAPEAPMADDAAKSLEMSEDKMEESSSELSKAQKEVSDLKVKMGEQAGYIATLANAVKKLAEQPIRKAATSMTYITKSEEAPQTKSMTRQELDAKLRQISKRSDLQKSDREVIIGFYSNTPDEAKLLKLLETYK